MDRAANPIVKIKEPWKFLSRNKQSTLHKIMKFTSETKNNILIVRLYGDLIGENGETSVLDAVTQAIQQKLTQFIIDISEVRYINSSGIGILITILTKFRNKGGEVYLLKPSESVKKLLVITKLNAIFQVISTESEILK